MYFGLFHLVLQINTFGESLFRGDVKLAIFSQTRQMLNLTTLPAEKRNKRDSSLYFEKISKLYLTFYCM